MVPWYHEVVKILLSHLYSIHCIVCFHNIYGYLLYKFYVGQLKWKLFSLNFSMFLVWARMSPTHVRAPKAELGFVFLSTWSTAGVAMSSRSWTLQCHAIELPAFMSPTEVGALKAQPGFVFLYKCHSAHTCLCVNVNCIEPDSVLEICLLHFQNSCF